jgi:hypothetical protein
MLLHVAPCRMAQHRIPRSVFPALLAAAALGLLACALVVGSGFGREDMTTELASSSDKLAEMQREVQKQLVEAAKRRASAAEHKAQAVQLQVKAQEDSERAVLLHKQADLAHREAQLKNAVDALAKARLQVKSLKEKASELDATADKDRALADKAKEQILELEDKAGTYSEKAGEEADKIAVVQTAEAKTASRLPKLLASAKLAEKKAQELKADAAAHMRDSQAKSSRAEQLDEIAREKEQQARMMRQRLMAVLEQKAQTLEAQQHQAAVEEESAQDAARKAAAQAEALAGNAEEQASLARAAETLASQQLPEERAAQELVGSAKPSDGADKHALLHAAAQAKRASEAAKQSDSAEQQELSQEDMPEDRKVLEARRAANLKDAGAHAAALRAMRARVASDGGENEDAATGIEDEDGHLQLKAAHNPLKLAEDGHYSQREEAFKKALAAAYRKGYTEELSQEDDGSDNEDGDTHEDKDTSALAPEKPARMQMLGDTEMLQKGPGETVSLEKDAASSSSKGSAFPMLWEDYGSLGSETRRLEGKTRRLRHIAPRHGRNNMMGVDLARLYEDGHTSREEQAFQKDMTQYRGALQEERSAALAKAQRATQELAQLPGGRGDDYDSRRREDLRSRMHRVQSIMLSDPHDHWEVPSRHGGKLRVVEDEEGHLVLKHDYSDDRDGREDRLRERDDDGRARTEELSSVRESRLRRVEDELHDARRRDRRLEARTEKLQDEVEELSSRGRTQDLSEEDGRRDDRRRDDYSDRRDRERNDDHRREARRGPHRDGERREERRGRDGHAAVKSRDSNFNPDSTYEEEYARDPGHVSVAEIKFQHALKSFDHTKSILREGAIQDMAHLRLPQLVPAHLPGQGL